MRQIKLVSGLLVALSLGYAGCSSSDTATLPSCVADHMKEKLTELDAITECLVDELSKNFTTQAECEDFVAKNGGYPDSKTQACKNYFEEKASADAGAGN